MAAMDFSLRRDDRGISVFWMILVMGVGVFALLALVLVGTGGDAPSEYAEELEAETGEALIVDEGTTTLTGSATSQAASDENDETLQGDAVTAGGPQPEGDLSVERVEVAVEPAGAATTEGSLDAGVEGTGGGVQTDQENVVVDPDGTTAPVVPTPSGPEGRDDDALTQD